MTSVGELSEPTGRTDDTTTPSSPQPPASPETDQTQVPSVEPLPARSTALLDSLFTQSLDPAYAIAAKRRRQVPSVSRNRRTILTAGTMALAGLLLTLAADTLRPDAAAQRAGSPDLVSRVQQRRDLLDAQTDRVNDLQAEIARRQGAAAAGAGSSAGGETSLAAQAQEALAAAGATALRGPGLRVVLDDASGTEVRGGGPREGAGDSAEARVSASDVQQVVNALWAGGAEAVSINGHRLTSTAAIRFAGHALIVAFRPLTRPYTIEAIGGADLVSGFSHAGGSTYLEALEQFGIRAEVTEVTGQPGLTLPAGPALSPRYAATDSRRASPSSTEGPAAGDAPAGSSASLSPRPQTPSTAR